MSHLSANPSQLRTLAALLAMPANDALDALREVQHQAPWLQSSLPELERLPLDQWQAEHTRLFISDYPSTPCPPYEGAYLQGGMSGKAAGDLSGLYRRAGLQATDIPPDYLGTMLECAGYLIEQDMDELLRELTDQHLRLWLSRFADDLHSHAELALYKALSEQLAGLLPEPTDNG